MAPVTPLITSRDMRIDHDGHVLCKEVTCEITCDEQTKRIVIVGPLGAAIALAVSGAAKVRQGELRIGGVALEREQHIDRVGVVRLDPPRPPRVSVKGYLELHGLAQGLGRKQARQSATTILNAFGMSRWENHLIGSLSKETYRCVVLATSMMLSSPILVVESPLTGLERSQGGNVLSVLGHITSNRIVIATAARTDENSAEYDLLVGADHVVLTSSRAVLWQGPPNELADTSRSLSLWIGGVVQPFIDMLRADGFELTAADGTTLDTIRCANHALEPSPSPDALLNSPAATQATQALCSEQALQLCVRLPSPGATQQLLDIATRCNVAVYEMLPVLAATSTNP